MQDGHCPESPRKAFTCQAIREDGKPILVIGLGNHDCVRFELTWRQVAGVVLAWLPWVVQR
jgi:hypothetical protein